MTDPELTAALCERLRAIEACPVCGYPRKEFGIDGPMAIAVFACGADMVAIGGGFQTPLGCRTPLIDALAKIKTEEEAKLAINNKAQQ